MPKAIAILGSALFFAVAPTTVAGLIPWWITRWEFRPPFFDIEATRAFRSSELWSWTYTDGHYLVAPFGASGGDVDESNAAQLWSTVYLAVRPPR